ncbi:uncharacterized protein VP01_2742g5 [Puccinia sorghi]|uniref:Uncharacterized protein n=1 Tax=Puccinia sorghi TaxID=27349 RepID=A0A0L6V368_9BASI|nr:uncharacterized protein VP01_2742g5 [Puccinia sorghi]
MENLTTATQKISSPGLERFDELINKLRKSALTTRDNPFPSIHAPKPTKKSQPTKQEREVEVQAQTETTVNSPNKDGKTSKSPLSTTSPIAHSFIVNLSSSALSGPAEPSDPTDPPAAELNKLDWASLVEAARQSDAEEDELPDLTEWATKAVKDSLQDSPEHLPLKRDKTFKAAQIQVQSRPEIENPSSSSHSLAKIQLAGSLKPSPSSSTAPVKF